MGQYINMTPRWSELLGTWMAIVNDAVKIKKPDQMERFWSQVNTSFKATDNYNDLVTFLRDSEGWTEEAIESALKIGRGISEEKRNVVHEEEDS